MDITGIGYGSAYAYQGGWSQRSTNDISQLIASQIAEADADGDGALSLEESQAPAELFNQADTDGDGFLSESELLAMMQKVRSEGPPQGLDEGGQPPQMPSAEEMAARIIEEHDADGDGALSAEESESPAEMFSAADADGDGLVTEDELVAMMENMKPEGPPQGEGMQQAPEAASVATMAASLMEDNDEDGDGSLSVSEASTSEEVFDAMDTNEDGVVSQAELEAALGNILNVMQGSGLGFGAQAVNAAGGMAAYQEEMERLILSALTGGDTEDVTEQSVTGSQQYEEVDLTV
ncbi:hypothetical protein AAU61_21085 [Desulfocarbo indianensis]|nr:hypothetical protein AAU61_21085 [Desulfocarbo indianensis]